MFVYDDEFGGAQGIEFTTPTITLPPGTARVLKIHATGEPGGVNLRLPPADEYSPGAPVFYIISSSVVVSVYNHSGTVMVAAVGSGYVGVIGLKSGNTDNDWVSLGLYMTNVGGDGHRTAHYATRETGPCDAPGGSGGSGSGSSGSMTSASGSSPSASGGSGSGGSGSGSSGSGSGSGSSGGDPTCAQKLAACHPTILGVDFGYATEDPDDPDTPIVADWRHINGSHSMIAVPDQLYWVASVAGDGDIKRDSKIFLYCDGFIPTVGFRYQAWIQQYSSSDGTYTGSGVQHDYDASIIVPSCPSGTFNWNGSDPFGSRPAYIGYFTVSS